MASKGNEVANPATGTITPRTPFQQMLRAMAFDAQAEDAVFSGDDVNDILSATTEEEMWDADERPPLNFQHLAGCELEIISLDVKFSRDGSDILTPFVYKDEKGKEKKMYLIVTAVRTTDAGEKPLIRLPTVGERFTANTSARFIVAKLWWAQIHDLINPEQGKTFRCSVKEIELAPGQAVLKLRPPANRSVQSTLA